MRNCMFTLHTKLTNTVAECTPNVRIAIISPPAMSLAPSAAFINYAS
jgi:hypothetical protein